MRIWPETDRNRRYGQVAIMIVLAAAAIGFFAGIRDGVPRSSWESRAAQASPPSIDGNVMPATGYLDLRHESLGANADYASSLSDLTVDAEAVTAVSERRSRNEALEQRSDRRAYSGAPPTIPHDVEQLASDACLACHDLGVAIDGKSADGMPHPYLTNCQQCHVAASPMWEPRMEVASTFRGLAEPSQGARAWEGAPPTVPHATWMRDNCSSCHGIHGKEGLRTSHPERRSCLQCHAPSADLDRVDIGPAHFLGDLE